MGMIINRRRVMGGKRGLLPSGYTQLKYVNTGEGAYINTGVTCNNTTGEFEVNFRYGATGVSGYICGQGRNINQGNTFTAFINSNSILILRCNSTLVNTGYIVGATEWHNVSFTDGSFIYDGISTESFTIPITGLWNTFYFGAMSTYKMKNLDIGECKLLNTHHLIPALHNVDNVAGFYNLISNEFLESDNPDVPFIAGSVV